MKGLKKTFRNIAIVSILSIGAVLLWYYLSLSPVPYGGFTRNLVPSPLVSSKVHDLGHRSCYIAGVSNNHIYLGNYATPLQMLVFNPTMEKSRDMCITLPSVTSWHGPINIKVDSPYFHIFNGLEPFVYRGLLTRDTSTELAKNDSIFFKAAVPLDGDSYAFKAESAINHEDIIVKRNLTKKQLSIHENLLEKQIDGSFCTDGMLHYSRTIGSIVYVYFYRNQFIVSDTAFSQIVRINTIDTIHRARINVGSLNNGRTKTMTIPPFIVNKRSSVFGNLLFIQSNVRANNEMPLVFKNNPVIDVYNLQSKQYISSFYLPQYDGILMDSFLVSGSTLVALYDHYLVVYKLNYQALFSQ